ncbi:MAG: antibiotic biosynthesis monooxygenase [Bacteroidota bacterium]
MITRIVRMEFQPHQLPTFRNIFDQSKASIRAFPGCHHLELHQDPHAAHILYTYSLWESEVALDQYRKSELFGKVWPKTKALFAAKPIAYSLHLLETVVASKD